jgi:hypothetical protein
MLKISEGKITICLRLVTGYENELRYILVSNPTVVALLVLRRDTIIWLLPPIFSFEAMQKERTIFAPPSFSYNLIEADYVISIDKKIYLWY